MRFNIPLPYENSLKRKKSSYLMENRDENVTGLIER